ncbi:MAG: HAD hydrolase family protein [Gemmatimonadetes bacterium]|nr:HAD hydrolase family protein [Gemmatimonadota bacterium]MBI3566849.1 HAD hydrolase family protein [Gemmatimonadota bacterium]
MIAPAAAAKVKLVVLDVDGVLTDAGYYLGDVDGKPSELLRYDIQDGIGIYLMRMAGLKIAIITGRESESVRLRAAQLKVDALAQDKRARKIAALRRIATDLGVTLDEVAFLGDDLPDLGPLREVGMPVAVANAVTEVRDVASVHLTRTGGHGAIREFAEALLTARGEWAALVERYVADRAAEPLPA